MTPSALQAVFGRPFEEQIAFFRQKLNLPTERWDDIQRAAHDRAFVVAGAMKADLLADLRTAVDKAIQGGGSLASFRRDFHDIVAKHGWTGWTGEGTKAGQAWRTRVIHETNVRTSYAAGRHAQLKANARALPYWRYHHSGLSADPRPEHLAFDGLTLPHDHPFWDTHYPPNGWGCKCYVEGVPAPEPDDVQTPPADFEHRDPKTGEPAHIDKGWGYAPGANAHAPLLDLVEQKLLNLEAPIGARMWEALRPALVGELERGFGQWIDQVLRQGQSRHAYALVGVISPAEAAFYAKKQGSPPVAAGISVEDRLLVGKKAERHRQKGDALTVDEWKRVPALLDGAREAYWDTLKNNIIYVLPALDGERVAKLAVEVDFIGRRGNGTLNLVRSGFKMNPQALEDRTRYLPIKWE
jgi:hypothetical protein